MMMKKLWLVWNGEGKFTWPFTNYEGGNDPETGKIPNANRTGLTFAKTGRNALSIKLLESRPLWRSFPLSCLYPKFKIEVISYISIHVSELRDVIRGN